MFKKTQVIILPTNQKTSLLLTERNELHYSTNPVKDFSIINDYDRFQYLYFLSDEEIDDDNWILIDERNNKTQNNNNPIWKLGQVNNITNNCIFVKGRPYEVLNPNWCKKIIATTDESLKLNIPILGKGDISDFAHYLFLPKPSQDFIKQYVESYNEGNIITNVLVEYELSDSAKDFIENQFGANIQKLKVDKRYNTITIKLIKNNYSEEELLSFVTWYLGMPIDKVKKQLDKWNKENLQL